VLVSAVLAVFFSFRRPCRGMVVLRRQLQSVVIIIIIIIIITVVFLWCEACAYLHRALHRCVLRETAPRPGFGFSALPVLQCGILLLFLGLGFPLLPIHSTSDLGSYSHSLYLRVDL